MNRSAIPRIAAIAGSFAVGALCAALYRQQAKKTRKQIQKAQVATWEGEGGSVHGVPTPAPLSRL